MSRALFSVFLSLFIHFILTMLMVYAPNPASIQTETVQIELLNTDQLSQNETSKQIVREAIVPEKEKVAESEDPLRFWSNQTQRVRKQTRAANLGMTKNRDNQLETKPQPNLQEQARQDLERELAGGELMQTAGSNPSRPNLSSGVSTIGESMPQEMEVGSFTALNTDRYLFYSFYARVEDLIRYRWESMVQNALDTTPREKLQASARGRWTTQIEVLLTPQGNVQKILLMKEAGVKGFDLAATQAFAQARYFPNPPREMVEDDGLIHLKYSFTVYFDPRLLARP